MIENNIVGFCQTKVFEDPESKLSNFVNIATKDFSTPQNKSDDVLEESVKSLTCALAVAIDIALRRNINCYRILNECLNASYKVYEGEIL